uniref:Uncharacterized protein n=1 Tax=Plectus sambesii TaxID=2011161 RepID=A0A914V305_9BILA
MMIYSLTVPLVLLLSVKWALACDEPKFCEENKKYCITREKFRERCPCTCAADVSLKECCAQQSFEQPTCQKLCTYGLTESMIRSMVLICFNDFAKLQYCASNGYQDSTECCRQNGVTEDSPDKPGCSIFCQGKMPPCSRMMEYAHCATGPALSKAFACAKSAFDHPRWTPNAPVNQCT